MRVLAVVCVFVILGIIRGADADNNIGFMVNGATNATYTKFIKTLRAKLIEGTDSRSWSYGIPVLHQRVKDPQRFVLIDLINNNKTVIVAIDVVSANIVAYRVGGLSYFLRQGDPNVPVHTLFRDTTPQTLAFTVTYTELERAAGRSRGQINLGPSPLGNAISRLVLVSVSSQSIAESLIIVIQMVSEAARFRYIETQVGFTMDGRKNYLPGRAALSLEDHWSALSTEMQRALRGGIFTRPVVLQSLYGLTVVDSVASPVIPGIALLLYQCKTNIITTRMHVDDQCVVQNRTTQIHGPNGLCVDARIGEDPVSGRQGHPIQLWPCGVQANQQWTFQTDGSIRSMGKCMSAYFWGPGDYITLYDCTRNKDAIYWRLSTDGTITHSRSQLVLTAPGGVQGTTLIASNNTYDTTQGWRAGDDVEPTVSNIIGYNLMCIQADSNNSRVWMENCVLYGREKRQRWALYGDGTIRVASDHSLCLTSDGYSSLDVIIIKKCVGLGNQRWEFKTNGSISNPNTRLVMDVKENDVSLRQIILYPPTGNPNQQWLPTF